MLGAGINSRKGQTVEQHDQWCPGVAIGSFGFSDLMPTDDNRAAFMADSMKPGGISGFQNHRECSSLFDLPLSCSSCIGSWGNVRVLLSHPKSKYMRDANGASYWVPPVRGGKSLGNRYLPQFMNPADDTYRFFAWLTEFYSGLQQGVDTDGNNMISSAEFMSYLRGNERVNQKWLRRAEEERPCVVANALLHYQFVIAYAKLAVELRGNCIDGGVDTSSQCPQTNWETIQQWYGKGPPYVAEVADDDGSGHADVTNSAKCTNIIMGAGTSQILALSPDQIAALDLPGIR